MAGKPEEQAPRDTEDPSEVKPGGENERLGPVSIERMSKDDGRALIVYRVISQPAP